MVSRPNATELSSISEENTGCRIALIGRSYFNLASDLSRWMALLLIRVAEVRTERTFGATCTWSRMRPLFDRMHLGYFASPSGAIRQRTETQAEQARLFHAMGVPEPPRFFQIDPRTSAYSQCDPRLPTSRAIIHAISRPFSVSC